MHAGEVVADEATVRALLAAQHPRWADLPLTRVASGGTDHVLYRLGEDLVLRLPRIADALGQGRFDARWLPLLAAYLPLAVPEPVAVGEPGAGYPWAWSVCRWLDGADAATSTPADPVPELASLLTALREVPTAGAPAGPRGGPLASRDATFAACLTEIDTDTDRVRALWAESVAAGPWTAGPVWQHGDLLPGNLLVRDGRLAAVIDFGVSGVGDPACDLLCAWSLLDAAGRRRLRAALAVDDDTWLRGRGWALSVGVIALPYYRESNRALAAVATRLVAEVLAD